MLIISMIFVFLFSSIKYKIEILYDKKDSEKKLFCFDIRFLFIRIIINKNIKLSIFGINLRKNNKKKYEKTKLPIEYKYKDKKKHHSKIDSKDFKYLIEPFFCLIKRIFIIIKPDKLKLNLNFGLNSPINNTLAYVISKSIKIKDVNIEVDFVQEVFELEIYATGEIFVISLLKSIFKFIFNKNVILFINKVFFTKNKSIKKCEV
ncbi:MAG: hypothetical protein LBJ93_00120 [Clostridiales bacterium]|nr:hypothetical protein [Clostridiales bacterium]